MFPATNKAAISAPVRRILHLRTYSRRLLATDRLGLAGNDSALETWRSACRKHVRRDLILCHPHPEGWWGADTLALLGDAYLRASVLRCLGALVTKFEPCLGNSEMEKVGPPELRKGVLTRLTMLTISNAHQAAHCQDLLSSVISADDVALMLGSDHAKATCLEAAVGLVAEAELQQPHRSDTHNGNEPSSSSSSAVDSLSKVLLARTGVWTPSDEDNPLGRFSASTLAQLKFPLHAKNALQEAGGLIVLVERVLPSPDHEPVFRAEAELNVHRADSGAGPHYTKRAAEAAAATAVLALAESNSGMGWHRRIQ